MHDAAEGGEASAETEPDASTGEADDGDAHGGSTDAPEPSCLQDDQGSCVECTPDDTGACAPAETCVDGACVDLCQDIEGRWSGVRIRRTNEPNHEPTESTRDMEVVLAEVEGDTLEPGFCWFEDYPREPTSDATRIEGEINGVAMRGWVEQFDEALTICMATGDGHGITIYGGMFSADCSTVAGTTGALYQGGEFELERAP